MRQIILAILIALVLGSASSAWADVVVLKDGTRIEGDVKKSPGGWRITTAEGKVIDVTTDQVKSLEVGGSATKGSPEQATSNLLSLRRSVENVADLHQIIERYKRFIEQNKGTPAIIEAQKDLTMWEDRLERGLVKLGSKWVTAEERTAAADKALAVADQARDLVLHGRHHDADALLQQALDADPLCVPALYLRGVIQYQNNQLPASRKSFEAVAAIIADHAPSLNNLGVILWRQNAMMPSLARYDQSITASPINKYLLDNVAEVLALVPAEQRKNKVAQQLFRKFTEQDTRLQEAMAAKGLYRWGSTWIDRAEMQHLKDQEKEVNDKLAVARTEGETAERRVHAIDAEIASIEQSLRQIESQSVYRDPDGRLVRMPYPSAYYEMQNDEARLKAERAGLATKLEAARAKIKQLQAQLPQPKFTGVQKLVGAEGAPEMTLPPQAIPSSDSAAPEVTVPDPTPSAPPASNPSSSPTAPEPPTTAPATNPASPSSQPG